MVAARCGHMAAIRMGLAVGGVGRRGIRVVTAALSASGEGRPGLFRLGISAEGETVAMTENASSCSGPNGDAIRDGLIVVAEAIAALARIVGREEGAP